jgi:hypothetical protein
MAASKFVVTGEQFIVIDKRMQEIKRQLQQKSGSPLDPAGVAGGLQRMIEGEFNPIIAVKRGESTFEFEVDFDDPRWGKIDRRRRKYNFIMGIGAGHFPRVLVLRGRKRVRCEFLSFKREWYIPDALVEAQRLGLTTPHRAIVEVFGEMFPNEVKKSPVIGICCNPNTPSYNRYITASFPCIYLEGEFVNMHLRSATQPFYANPKHPHRCLVVSSIIDL